MVQLSCIFIIFILWKIMKTFQINKPKRLVMQHQQIRSIYKVQHFKQLEFRLIDLISQN